MVKSLFSKAKREVYKIDNLDECIRAAILVLEDAPQFTSAVPMDNIGNILQEAKRIRQECEI